MKTINAVLLSTLVLIAPVAWSHPDHGTPSGIKSMSMAPPAPVEKSHGRPGDTSQPSRSINIEINDKLRVAPAEVSVKQGETIKFIVKNSTKTPQRMALGILGELKERATILKQFPIMEMNQPNLLHVKPGESAELLWQFTQVGTFNFSCSAQACLEPAAIGKVVVDAT